MAIPNNLANIKYRGITGSTGGISQVAADKSYASFNTQNRVQHNSMMQSAAARQQNIENEKASQKKLDKTSSDYYETEMMKVVGLTDVGNSNFDDNKQNYFYDLKDRYVKIKNYMDENPDYQAAGAKELAKINQQIEVFKESAPIMVIALDQIKKSLEIPTGQPGAMSSMVPTDVQVMLMALQGGGPEVTMVNGEDGNLVLYMPEQEYMENGETKTTKGAQFNLNKFIELQRNGGEFFETIPDYRPELKEIADDVIKTSNGKDNPLYYTLNEVSVGENKNAVVKEWNDQIIDPATQKPMIGGDFLNVMGQEVPNPFKGQKINGEMLAQMDLIRTGAFNSLLKPQHANDNDAAILWTDVIGTDKNGNPGQDTVWDPTNKEQLSVALNWLSREAVNEFGIEEGVLTHQNKKEEKSDGQDSVSYSRQEASSLLNDLREASNDREAATNYFKNKTINGKEIYDVNYLELGKKPGKIELLLAVGKEDVEPMEFDLNNTASLKNLIQELVKDQYGSDNTAESIRSEIYRMLKDSGKKKTTKEDKKPLPIKK